MGKTRKMRVWIQADGDPSIVRVMYDPDGHRCTYVCVEEARKLFGPLPKPSPNSRESFAVDLTAERLPGKVGR